MAWLRWCGGTNVPKEIDLLSDLTWSGSVSPITGKSVSANGSNSWTSLSPTSVPINNHILEATLFHSNSHGTNPAPFNEYVDVSTDGTNWTNIISLTGSTITPGSVRTYNLTAYNGQRLYFRFRITSSWNNTGTCQAVWSSTDAYFKLTK